MRHHAKGRSADDEIKAFENRLRQMPKAEAPEGLEARIVSRIPRVKAVPFTMPWRGRRALVAAALLTVAALSAVGAFMRLGGGANGDMAGLLNDTSPSHILRGAVIPTGKETRPCDVLPPLAYWR